MERAIIVSKLLGIPFETLRGRLNKIDLKPNDVLSNKEISQLKKFKPPAKGLVNKNVKGKKDSEKTFAIKRIQLSSSTRISYLIIDALKDFFPIKQNEILGQILSFINERLHINFDIKILETELLLATRQAKLQFIIKQYFNSLRTSGRDNDSNQRFAIIKVSSLKSKSKNVNYKKSLSDVRFEREEERNRVLERHSDFERLSKKLQGLETTSVWKQSISFSENEEDIIHRK